MMRLGRDLLNHEMKTTYRLLILPHHVSTLSVYLSVLSQIIMLQWQYLSLLQVCRKTRNAFESSSLSGVYVCSNVSTIMMIHITLFKGPLYGTA